MQHQRSYDTQLGVFAKHWQAGKVKTRLAKTVGPRRAAELYLRFLKTTLHRFENISDHSILCYSPQDKKESFQDLLRELDIENWILKPQVAGDLGQRMAAYFAESFQVNCSARQHVALIGSDSPTLPVEYVQQAFNWLEEVDVVLGPTDDGGYYLIAMKQKHPEIFADVSWSSCEVFKQTIAKLEFNNISYKKLPVWFDVDEEKDLQRLNIE